MGKWIIVVVRTNMFMSRFVSSLDGEYFLLIIVLNWRYKSFEKIKVNSATNMGPRSVVMLPSSRTTTLDP